MPEIAKISFSHEAIINWLVLNPEKQLRDCAAYFGYTQAWLSTIIHSDIFQAKLRARQDEVFGEIVEGIPEKLRALADVSIEKLTQQVEQFDSPRLAMDACSLALKSLGYGAPAPRGPVVQNVQNNFQVSAEDLANIRQKMLAQSLGNTPNADVINQVEVLPATDSAAKI